MLTKCFIGGYRDLNGQHKLGRSAVYEGRGLHNTDRGFCLLTNLTDGLGDVPVDNNRCFFLVGGRGQINDDLNNGGFKLTFASQPPYYACIVTHNHLTGKNYTVIQIVSVHVMNTTDTLKNNCRRITTTSNNPNKVKCEDILTALMSDPPLLKYHAMAPMDFNH